MSNNFGKYITKEQQTQSLADYLPNGRLFAAKNISFSSFRKFLAGIASELWRCQQKIVEIVTNWDIETADGLLENWEEEVGIPLNCFKNTVTIEQRRAQVKAKFRANGCQTAQDYKDLAKILGYNINVVTGLDAQVFPLSFPAEFSHDEIDTRFTMYIDFTDAVDKYIFPLVFPVQFSSGDTNVVECLFNQIKPANVLIIYRYLN